MARKTGERKSGAKTAVFAGGCFWCTDQAFRGLAGVTGVTTGYANGHVEKPSYGQVCDGGTGHYEAVRVTYDPARITYERLLDAFWHSIDPTDAHGQFADQGGQYTTAVLWQDEQQRKAAEASKKRLEASGRFDRSIATKIEPFRVFYPAEDSHQDYARKCPIRYGLYKAASGRERYLKEAWGE